MKKTLVAIAAVVATTGAMAEATLTGSVQVGTNSKSVVTTGAAAVNTFTMGDDNGNTVFNIGDTEDLGGGLTFKGNIAVETGNTGGTATTLGINGVNETYGAFIGGFGSIKAGALQTPIFNAGANGDAGGGLLIGNVVWANNNHQSGTVGSGVALQASSIQYTTPTFAEGLSLKYQAAFAGNSGNIGDVQYLAADYKTGAFAAGIVTSAYKYSSSATDTTSTYYATYDLGVATLKLLGGNAKTNGYATVTSTSYGVSVPMGAVTFMYNHSSSDGKVNNGTATTARVVTDVDQAADFLGASYSFSKRTTGYAAIYKETGNNGAGTYTATSNISYTKFIVIHAF